MPYKDPEKQKQYSKTYSKKWYEKNKERVIERVAENRRKSRAKWLEFKATLSCSHCNFSHPAVIDFHHVVRDGTKEDVNALVSNGNYGRAYKEIKKCIPLCANCHRILHWGERAIKNPE